MGSSDSDSSSSSRSSGSREPYYGDKRVAKEQKKLRKKIEKDQKRAYKDLAKQQERTHASLGKSLFVGAYEGAPTVLGNATGAPLAGTANHLAPLVAPRTLQIMRTHDVDETRPDYSVHGIIRAEQGEYVELLDGSLKTGLPPPYSDYVLVRTSRGKVGKVGRLCFS